MARERCPMSTGGSCRGTGFGSGLTGRELDLACEVAADELLGRLHEARRRARPWPSPSAQASSAPIGLARAQQLETALHADEPRQPLRAAVAGDDSEVHLGLAELQARADHAGVARHRELAAAAEHRTVERRDDRLGRARRFRRGSLARASTCSRARSAVASTASSWMSAPAIAPSKLVSTMPLTALSSDELGERGSISFMTWFGQGVLRPRGGRC